MEDDEDFVDDKTRRRQRFKQKNRNKNKNSRGLGGEKIVSRPRQRFNTDDYGLLDLDDWAEWEEEHFGD